MRSVLQQELYIRNSRLQRAHHLTQKLTDLVVDVFGRTEYADRLEFELNCIKSNLIKQAEYKYNKFKTTVKGNNK